MTHVVKDIVIRSQHFLLLQDTLLLLKAEQVVAEGWNHEELLQDAIHVANVAQVNQSDELFTFSAHRGRTLVPAIRLWQVLLDLQELAGKEFFQLIYISTHDVGNQIKGILSAL